MSGGSLDYFYCQLNDHIGDFKDKELDDLVADLADLFHDREWYLSSDIGEGEWNEARDKFKQKWFGEGARAERIEKYLDEVKADVLKSFGLYEKYCKDCKYWRANPDITKDGKLLHSDLGKCEFVTTCLFHRCETCDRWERRCGGISDDTEVIEKMIVNHRQQAIHIRDCVHSSTEDRDPKNDSELLDQALDCDLIANWLEELLVLRSKL